MPKEKDSQLQSLLDKIRLYRKNPDIELITKAYHYAENAHRGQARLSGEDFFEHPFKTAIILADLRVDDKTIAAGLLHDVCEDTPITISVLQSEFGKEIAFLVDGVTKLTQLRFQLGREDYVVENLRRMILAMSKDIRVLLIKLSDRMHNLETLSAMPAEKQKEVGRETLEIYAPLALRLGMGEMKGILEDLAFPYVYPKEYTWVRSYSQTRYRETKEYIKRVERVVKNALERNNITAQVHSRAKHHYSLYKKLLTRDKNLDKIYDLVALRVIVDSIEECYSALGLIHKMWKPLPGLIKDYIALPKPNGYRSLHTTVFCLDGKIVEFQIRTTQMHQEAENGIAAHWYYSEQKQKFGQKDDKIDKGFKVPMDAYSWVKRLSTWQNEIQDNHELIETLKLDVFSDRIFVFTPKGKVIDLPINSTPIDFAYEVHTQIGDSCTGVKINGEMAELSIPLKNRDIVEIVTSKKQLKPRRDWLGFVVTNLARKSIKKALKEDN